MSDSRILSVPLTKTEKKTVPHFFSIPLFFSCAYEDTRISWFETATSKKKKKAKWNQQTDTVSAVCRISFALPPDREMERGTTYRISREWTKEHLTPECLTVTNTSTYMGCLSLCDRFSSLPHAAFFSFHLRALFLFVSVVCLCLAFVVMIIWAMSLHILCYFAVCLTNVPKFLGHMLRHDNGWEDKKILWRISMK